VPRDVTFIVDTSGSMHGPSMDQAKQAVLKALKRLGPADRFNVIRFADETRALFAAAAPATPDNVARAWYYVKALKAEGGTMMRPALERALAAGGIGDESRLAQVIFVTDGAVGNEDELFALIAERLGGNRLFTIGIGSAPNSYFMRKSAELGRGSFTHIGDVMEVERRMEALLRKLENPALTDLSSAWPDAVGEAVQQYPQPIPDLYAGEPVVFTARLEGVALSALEGHLVIGGKRGGRDWQRRLSLNAMDDAPGVAAIWARAKLEQIEDGRYKGADPQDLRRRALAVALAHRLVTRYTSLVAVAEEIVRPPEEMLKRGEIARNLPEGWDYEHVFGEAGKTMRLRELPAPLLRKSSATNPIDLPRGATTARQQMLFGALFLSLSLLMLVFARLGRRLRRA
jgi:Ca-activated chloride channel family protein